MVIPARFDEVLPFSEGLAAVKVGDLWGYIDTSGKMVIAPQFFHAFSFSGGLASIGADYIDLAGKVAISTRYAWVSDFSQGLAEVTTGVGPFDPSAEVGYIDTAGKVVWPLQK